MKPLVAILPMSILLSLSVWSQSDPYSPRGTKPYLVNYGAINGDRCLATFAAKRFVLLDESSPADIALVRAVSPSMPILVYRDVVALHASFSEFAKVDKDEWAFLHAGEPSALAVDMHGDTASLYWMADRRVAASGALGYRVYWSIDSADTKYRLADTVIAGTSFTVRLPKSVVWLSVATVTRDTSELLYGLPVRKPPMAGKEPRIRWKDISLTVVDSTERYAMRFEVVSGDRPDSVVLVRDRNGDNLLDTLRERYPVSDSGAGRFSASMDIRQDPGNKGGCEFILLAYAGGARYRFPEAGSWSTNVNNRLMNSAYGFYAMDVGASAWRQAYIGQVLSSFTRQGYSGLFEDDTWYRVERWGVDAHPPFGYSDATWNRDLYDFLDSIKLAIAPRPAYYNGLYVPASEGILAHTDGGMTEGFAYTHWSGFVANPSWKTSCNVGLHALHTYGKTWLALGGAPYSDPNARLYVLASYLLVSDSLSMYANATSYQEFSHFPEFDLPLGAPLESASADVDELLHSAAGGGTYYERRFEHATVVVNPSSSSAVVYPGGGGTCIAATSGTTVDGGRLFTETVSATIPPKSARIFLRPGDLLVSPLIDSIEVQPVPVPADGATRATIRARVRDDASNTFRSDPDLPPFVTADLGMLGGPKELRLLNDGSFTPGIPSWFEGSFTIVVGAPPTGQDVPVTALSTTGLVAVRKTRVEIASADSANLVLNYSFEIDNNEDGRPDLWIPYAKGFEYDTTGLEAKSGQRSVHVRNDSLTEGRGVYYRITLDQTAPHDLEVSGWSKALGVSGAKNNDYSLYVDLWYQDGTPLYGQTAQFEPGTHDWQYSSRVIRPTKAVKNASLYVLFRNHVGEAWFDHLALRPYSEPNAVQSPPVKSGSPSLRVFPNPSLGECLLTFDVMEAGDAIVLIHTLLGDKIMELYRPVRSGRNSLPLDLGRLPNGKYIIMVRAAGELRHGLVHVLR